MRIDIDTCEEILITITRNKTRSLLTAFGVFWVSLCWWRLSVAARACRKTHASSKDLQPTRALSLHKRQARLIKVFAKDDGGIWRWKMWTVYAMWTVWRLPRLPLPDGDQVAVYGDNKYDCSVKGLVSRICNR